MKIKEVAANTFCLETPVPGVGLLLSSYLIDIDAGILIEPGPSTALPAIREGMEKVGMKTLDWIIPTHIHMDHGGGTGKLAQIYPNAKVIAHPISHKHLIDPDKLIQSTRFTYGEDFESLYGPIVPVPSDQLMVVEDNETIVIDGHNFTFLHAPGHAPHHVAVFDHLTRGVFCGEAAGMDTSDPLPAAAAPGFNLTDCLETMQKLKDLQPEMLFYSHGGMRNNAVARISRAMENTRLYGETIKTCLARNMSPETISQRIMEQASPSIPGEWEEEMIHIWITGIVEGYSLYLRNNGWIRTN